MNSVFSAFKSSSKNDTKQKTSGSGNNKKLPQEINSYEGLRHIREIGSSSKMSTFVDDTSLVKPKCLPSTTVTSSKVSPNGVYTSSIPNGTDTVDCSYVCKNNNSDILIKGSNLISNGCEMEIFNGINEKTLPLLPIGSASTCDLKSNIAGVTVRDQGCRFNDLSSTTANGLCHCNECERCRKQSQYYENNHKGCSGGANNDDLKIIAKSIVAPQFDSICKQQNHTIKYDTTDTLKNQNNAEITTASSNCNNKNSTDSQTKRNCTNGEYNHVNNDCIDIINGVCSNNNSNSRRSSSCSNSSDSKYSSNNRSDVTNCDKNIVNKNLSDNNLTTLACVINSANVTDESSALNTRGSHQQTLSQQQIVENSCSDTDTTSTTTILTTPKTITTPTIKTSNGGSIICNGVIGNSNSRFHKPRLSLSSIGNNCITNGNGYNNSNNTMPSVHGRPGYSNGTNGTNSGTPQKTRLSTHQRNLSLDFR